MEILKHINLFNFLKMLIIALLIILLPLLILNKIIKKYVKCPVSKLIKAFNI